MLTHAATVDPEAADILRIPREQRITGQSRVAYELARRGMLADGLTEGEATDVFYALTAPEM